MTHKIDRGGVEFELEPGTIMATTLETIAAWGELLGIEDPGEIVDAMLIAYNTPRPEPDPETGANVWTGVYAALRAREQAKEEGIVMAARGTDPVTEARNTTRAALGLPPIGEPVMAARGAGGPGLEFGKTSDPLADLKADLATHTEEITTAREKFLASLTGETLGNRRE